MRFPRIPVFRALALFFSICPGASAQVPFAWTNLAGGSWTNAANWVPAAVPGGTDAIADFSRLDLGGDVVVTLDGPRTAGQLRFADVTPGHHWFLAPGSAGPLTLDTTAGAPVIAVSNHSATLSVPLAGTRGFAKAGAGTLVLTASNTVTGDMTNHAGMLQLNGVTGRVADTARLTFAGTGGFTYDNAGATTTLAETMGSLYFLAGEGTVKSVRTEPQTNSLITAYNNHTLGASGNFLVVGGVNGVDNKIVLIGRGAGLLSGRHVFHGTNFVWYDPAGFVRGVNYGVDTATASVGAGATVGAQHDRHVRITGSITAQVTATNRTLNISGPHDFTLAPGATYTFVNGFIKAGGGVSTFSGGASIGDVNNELPIRVDQAGETLVIDTRISGNFAVTKAGAGTLVLGSAANDFTNSIFINNGVVKLGAGDAVPDGVGKGGIVLQETGTFDLGGFNETINGLSGGGGVDNSGTSSATLVVGANGQSSSFYGAIRNSGQPLALTKTGAGTLTLNGSNSFTGTTLVSSGRLALGVSGSLRGGTNIVVGPGATLDVAAVGGGFRLEGGQMLRGSGTVTGAVTIAAGAVLFPDAGFGRLTMHNSLALQGEVILRVNKSGPTLTNDSIAAASAGFGGTLSVTASGDPLAAGDAFKLFEAGTYGGAFATLNLPVPGANLVWSTATLAVDGTLRVSAGNSPPAISSGPPDLTAELCDSVTLTALVSGSDPLAAQWFYNSTALPGATNLALSLTALTPAQAGAYQLVVTNHFGSATSRVATLTLADSIAPVVSNCPPPRTLYIGTNDTAPAPDFAAQIAASDCSLPLTIMQLPTAGAPLNPGTTNVTVSVRDASNNLATCVVPVQVLRPYGPARNAPESAAWTLACSLTLPNAAAFTNSVPYDIDHRRWLSNFTRIAYYLELQPSNAPVQFIWAAMDAFTPDGNKAGLPSADTGAGFQQAVLNLDVRSSVPGVTAGNGMSGGSIHFSSNAGGTMQVMQNSNSLFAVNGWAGGTPGLGIGEPVVSANAPSFTVKRLLVYVLPATNRPPTDSDVVIYGGTSGGVAAAVQVARMGKRPLLICTDNHLGGLSSGGLGATDTGNISTIGGLSREFYRRVGQRYGMAERFIFEPRIAEQTFQTMLAEAGVPVLFNQQIASVTRSGLRITELVMTDGSVHRGRMFIDTTYEGDVLALAGVSFAVGREGTNVYGETLNGIRPSTAAHQFVVNVDPYVTPGDAGSGLLPYIQPGNGGTPGDGDARVQAYNFRLCLTQTAANRMPVHPPPDYDAWNYELLARYIAARVAAGHSLTVGSFMNLSTMPNAKTDVNNNGAFSSDFIGMNHDFPTNTHAARAASRQRHEDYHRGFLHFLGNDPRVPAALRGGMLSWGLSIDEFLDTGGWPHSMYVREGRRMVGEYVMTQDNCAWRRFALDSVGLASYNMDSHNCQRIVQGGVARNEGDVQSAPAGPFAISYRSIVPRSNECANLFATFALSGSHIAFSSCRMEPVFMMTSQSAGAAAAFAIDDNVSVQQVNYDRLAVQLQGDGQMLRWGNSGSGDGLIVDNGDGTNVSVAGAWTTSSASPGYWGFDYLHDGNADKGAKSVTFTPVLPSNGVYEVFLRWTENANRAPSVPVDVIHPGGTNTVFVNQQVNGGLWVLLFTTNFHAGTNAKVLVRTDGTTGFVIADAVRFAPPGSTSGTPAVVMQVVATANRTAETNGGPAIITLVRTGDTNSAVTVNYVPGGSASNGVDYVALSGSVTLPPGVVSARLFVNAVADALNEGEETVVVTLSPGAGYGVGGFNTATVVIADAASSNAPPALLPVEVGTNGVTVTFTGTPGAGYTIERTTNLLGGWLPITNLPAAPSGVTVIRDTNTAAGEIFYRARTP
jgi:autotransporter-associated beta strand protein